MTEKQAKKQLQKMLQSFSQGSILHLLAELFREEAEEARRDGDVKLYRQCKLAESALIVVGMGLDAVSPQ
jgi:hypothetical protein